MLGRPDLSFKSQREALAQAATGADVENTYGQAMRAAAGLIAEQQRLGQAALAPVGNGITKEALEALWNGRDAGLQSQIDGTNQKLSGIQSAGPQTDRESYLVNGLIQRGMNPQMAEAFVINMKDESGLKSDITEGAPNVHGTRGQGLYQLTDVRPGVGRRSDYLNFMAQRGDNNLWSDDSQLDFAMWEYNNTEKANWAKVAQMQGVGNMAAGIAKYVLRPASEHLASRTAKYLKLGY